MNRDIVVVGASAGGIGPLCTLVKELPDDLPAAVFICLHVGSTSILDQVLHSCGKRSVARAQHDQPYKLGMIYVAPPGVHLTIGPSKMNLLHTATENRHRPSIDVLFRSAAKSFGPRVIGVILSGCLDDGAAGIFAIKAKGGLTIVQDPADAVMPDMPRAALKYTDVDHCVPVSEIPNLIAKGMKPKSAKTRQRANGNGSRNASPLPALVPFVCPDCDGPISQSREGKLLQFQCSVGHKYSPESFTEAHRDALERALWIAIRTLENRGQVHRFLAERARESGNDRTLETMTETAEAAARDMELIKQIMARL
jgi:two-component system, chemotaxis family, protein-glutamate methylesterase/glutaminase